MHRFEPGCELYVPIPEGMEQAVHWAGGEPVAVLNYQPANRHDPANWKTCKCGELGCLSSKPKVNEDAMEKMRRWIENTFSGTHMREVVVH